MAAALANYANSRDNNFNLIRFVAASLVLFSHSFALTTGTGDAEPLRFSLGMTWGYIAVDIFFITSGFLICGSFIVKQNLIAFTWARVLRIYPALIVAMFISVFVIGASFTMLGFWEYLSHEKTYNFLAKNTTLIFGISNTLPGVFEDVPFKFAINGSLWTLPYELKMYFILAIMLSIVIFVEQWISWITIKRCLLLVAIATVSLHIISHIAPFYSDKFFNLFIRLFSLFFYGAAFYAWKEKIILSTPIFWIMVVVVLLSAMQKDIFFICYSLFLPYIIFYIAYVPKGKIRRFNELGDYSYGMYIYAWPIQQSVVTLIPNLIAVQMIIYSFIITLILAIFSWYMVEKKALKLKNKSIFLEKYINSFFKTCRRRIKAMI